MTDLVRTDIDRATGVASVTLDRSEARNPTSIAMLDALDAALDVIDGEPMARALILGGAGRSFCSGLDLAEVRADDATVRRMLDRLSAVMRRIRRLPIVTVAAVQGAAIGGGFGFMAACDFRVTHAEAKIGYPPLETCLSPALMAPWLIRLVGPGRARALLLRGGSFTGREAFDLGIATHLVAAEEIPDTARQVAHETTRGGRFATSAMKALLDELDGGAEDAALDRAAAVSAEVIVHPESRARLVQALPGGSAGR